MSSFKRVLFFVVISMVFIPTMPSCFSGCKKPFTRGTQLAAAIKHLNENKVQELLDQEPGLAQQPFGKQKRTSLALLLDVADNKTLSEAQQTRLKTIMQTVLDKGVSPNTLIDSSPLVTWLGILAGKGCSTFSLAETVMKHVRFDPFTQDTYGNTPLALLKEDRLSKITEDRKKIEELLACKEAEEQNTRIV